MSLNLRQKHQNLINLSVAMLLLCTFFMPCYAMADVSVNNGYVIKPLTKGAVTAGYADFYNEGNNEVKLMYVTSGKAKSIEIHNHERGSNGEIRMVKLNQLEIPADSKVSLQQGGLHLMVYGLSSDLKVGDVLPLIFIFDDKSSVVSEFKIKALE